ncbi:hypothetical protein B9G98_00757 [Wickerhamiella sorbophila]|uniref:Major facilitator superfamily (MFS) profile domain-containing protein n=1 Tax=Wickerhamiella sorbophila TaxID=45607 RepID=A0A2T0FDU8_9ASCO|nr:hypothetical protein B9G98_00757 [Wickerhamiella sorbophila]PRT53137.1 hypothetical protein B9G98_00757 [Wickerhamiella sorbophila]
MEPQLAHFLVVSLGMLQFGLHMAELNTLVPFMDCAKFPDHCLPGIGDHYALASSIYAVGGCLGSAVAGPIANRFGRKTSFKFIGFGFLLGSLFMWIAGGMFLLTLGRFVVGIFAGLAIVIGPMFVAEFTSVEKRRPYGIMNQFAVNCGISATLTAGYISENASWRAVLFLGVFVAAVQIIMTYNIHESPLWLTKNNKFREAQQIADHLGVTLDEVSNNDGSHFVSIPTFITSPEYIKVLLTVVGIFTLQQFSGINAIVFYGVKILERSSSSRQAAIGNVAIQLTNASLTLVAATFIKRTGPKKLIIFSCLGMALASVWLGIALDNDNATPAFFAIVTDVSFFALGLGPVPFMVVGELVPSEAVGAAQSVATMSNWLATFVIGAFFPSWRELMGEKVFFLFSACAATGGIALSYIL